MRLGLVVLVMPAILAGPPAARGEEPRTPLRLHVHPSGTEEPEGLDAKLARRLRESDALFRHICRGCNPADAAAAAPFEPMATLRRKGVGERPVRPRAAQEGGETPE